MVLVPEALLNSLQEKQREQIAPVTNSLVRLRGEMNQVLGDQTDDVNDDEKAKAYSQSLQRYLAYKEKQSDNPLAVKLVRQTDSDPAEGVDFSGIEQEVIQSAPASMRGKAKLLMKKLKANSDVLNWNERGEVAFGDQPPLRGSNIVDLALDVLRERKRFNQPIGWEKFAKSMASINLPGHYIGNPERRRAVQSLKEGAPSNPQSQGMDATTESSDDMMSFPPAIIPPTKASKRKSLMLSPPLKRFKYKDAMSTYKSPRPQRLRKAPKWMSL